VMVGRKVKLYLRYVALNAAWCLLNVFLSSVRVVKDVTLLALCWLPTDVYDRVDDAFEEFIDLVCYRLVGPVSDRIVDVENMLGWRGE